MHDSLKKGFTTAVATATMLWSVGAASFVAPLTAHAANAGDVIRGTTLSTLYYQGNDGKRYAFPNEKTYLSWYADFSGVQKISDSALAAIPLGGNVAYRPGARWIKIQSDPKTYAVAPNGALRWIESESVASGLAGSDWNQFIDDVADVFFVDYTVGASLTSAANAYNGALVKAADGTYYVIQNGAKRKVTSAGFSANRLQSRLALDGSGINLSAMSSGSDVTGKEAWLSDAAQLPEQAIGGGLSVSLASDSPVAMTVPSKATSVAFMKFNLSASGATTVNSITIKQGGVGATSTVSNVYLYDGNTRLTDARSINSSSREATFGALNLALSAGQTKTLTVVVDMADNATGGDTVSFEISGASSVVGSSTVSGSFPIKGATMTTSSTDVGALTLEKSGSMTNPTLGQKQAIIGEFKLTANAVEGVKLQRIRLDVNEATAHTNYNLYQNGTLVAVGTRTASDKVDFVFTNPFAIAQGSNKIFQLKADIGGQNGDDISVAVEETTDVFAVGDKYGFGVSVTNSSYSATNCTLNSQSCSFSDVQGGKLTIAYNSPSVTKFKPDQKGLVLMDLTVTSQNAVQIRSLAFNLAGSDFDGNATTDANFQNFRLVNKATGQSIAGPEEFDGTFDDEADNVTFGDDWDMAAGQSLDLQLLVDAMGSSIPYDVGPGETITATLDVSTISARDANNDTLAVGTDIVPGTDLVGQAMAAQAASMTVSVSQPPSTATYVKGASNVDVVAYSVVAGAASKLTVSSLKFTAWGDADGTWSDEHDLTITDKVTSCSVYDAKTGGLVDGPESFNSSGRITFNGFNWIVPAGETGKVLLRCNFANVSQSTGADDDYVFFLDNDESDDGSTTSANAITAVDMDSNTVTDTGLTDDEANNPDGSEGVIISIVNSGVLTFALAGDNPTSTIILSNSTGVLASKFKVTATKEAFTIKKLSVKSDDNSTLNGVTNIVLEYKDKAGVTKTASGSLASAVVTFSNLDLYVAKDTPTYINVKVNTGDVTTDNAASGDVVQLELHMDEVNDNQFEAVGESSGSTLDDDDQDASVSGAISGMGGGDSTDDNDTDLYLNPGTLSEIRKTKPTFSLASGSPSGAGIPGLAEVFRFNVSADSRGYVTLDKVTFKMTSTDNTGTPTQWNDCDTDAAAGINLAEATDMEIYNAAAPNIALDEGTTPWTWFKSTGAACNTTAADLTYFVVNFGASGGSIASEEIGAGATKTYVLRLNTTGASAANDDSIRIDIPSQAEINSLSVGSGTDLDDDAVVQWDDANLTNSDALDIDGDFVDNLAITGGTIVY